LLASHRITLIGSLVALSLYAQETPPSRRATPPNRQRQARTIDKNIDVSARDSRESDPVSSSIDQLSSQIKAWKDQQAVQYNQDHPDGRSGADWWANLSAIVSAAAALLIAIWAALQWGAMSRLRAVMEAQSRHMSDALRAIQQSAEAAVTSARSTERSLNAVIDKQRARLAVTLTLGDTTQPAEGVSVTVRIRNAGETDALGVRSKAACDLSERTTAGKEPSDWHHSNRLEPGREDSVALFPLPPMSESELDAIRRGKQTIRVRVRAEFADVFGINRHFHAAYRLEAIFPEGSGTPKFEWISNPAKCYETEEREHSPAKTTPKASVTTELGSLLKL
jgi:hypothetical protein